MRVRREAEAMGRLGDHANVVTVHDVVEEGPRVYLVCQYMAGPQLAQTRFSGVAHSSQNLAPGRFSWSQQAQFMRGAPAG